MGGETRPRHRRKIKARCPEVGRSPLEKLEAWTSASKGQEEAQLPAGMLTRDRRQFLGRRKSVSTRLENRARAPAPHKVSGIKSLP